ncbi:unnamed protein product [Prorocentrum cordatum]|uniref:Uncharacterized protein n=1 Tax=Prorocentrum cordatum TaxID=2364126 RepID=A0ABN9XJI9_9DINO|nr:unnamed protein product [Polarella glacialis]
MAHFVMMVMIVVVALLIPHLSILKDLRGLCLRHLGSRACNGPGHAGDVGRVLAARPVPVGQVLWERGGARWRLHRGDRRSPDCTYHAEEAGSVRVDELTGITDPAPFLRGTKRMYDPETDAGTGCSFWDGRQCASRASKVKAIFKTKYEHLPDLLGLRFPRPAPVRRGRGAAGRVPAPHGTRGRNPRADAAAAPAARREALHLLQQLPGSAHGGLGAEGSHVGRHHLPELLAPSPAAVASHG